MREALIPDEHFRRVTSDISRMILEGWDLPPTDKQIANHHALLKLLPEWMIGDLSEIKERIERHQKKEAKRARELGKVMEKIRSRMSESKRRRQMQKIICHVKVL